MNRNERAQKVNSWHNIEKKTETCQQKTTHDKQKYAVSDKKLKMKSTIAALLARATTKTFYSFLFTTKRKNSDEFNDHVLTLSLLKFL